MSDDKAGKKKKGGKSKNLLLIVGLVALLGGGGAAGGFYAAGMLGGHEKGPHEDPNRPQLVLKGENPEEIANSWAAKAKASGESYNPGTGKGIDLPAPGDPSRYEATYFQIEAPFTSNMKDSDAFAQMSFAVSTYYDHRVIQAMQTHQMAIRSAILMLLADQDEITLATPQGKEQLQGRVKKIINDVLKQKTGFGGIDNVYFTNFVIQ